MKRCISWRWSKAGIYFNDGESLITSVKDNTAQYWNLLIGEGSLRQQIKLDAEALLGTATSVLKLALAVEQFMQDRRNEAIGAVISLIAGDAQKVKNLGGEYAEAFSMAAEVLDFAAEEWDGLSEGKKGYYMGRLSFEIASCFCGAAIAKVATKAQFVTKLVGRPFFQSGKGASFAARLVAFIQRLFTTKMCFVAGTLVMTQGGLKPIETIRAGEVVWSRNEVTQAEGWQPVVDTFTTHPEMLHTLRVDADEDGVADAETLTCTGEHPFWVVEENAFVPAAELRPGWHLLRAHGSGQVTVLGIESTRAPPEQPFTTYNFEVATDHTYFVGQSGVWVHNEGKDCTKIFSMFHRAARSLGGVDNLKARRLDVLADVRRQSRLTGEKIAHASWQKSANDVSYKMLADFDSGGFDRIDDFPTVARWDAEFYLKPPGFRPSVDTPPPGMLYRGDFDLHHIAPKELMNALKARQVIPAGFDLDMVPGLVMKRGDHQEMNKALNPLINSLKQNQNINGSQLVKAVYDYYDNNGQKSQAKVLRAFFDRIGITF